MSFDYLNYMAFTRSEVEVTQSEFITNIWDRHYRASEDADGTIHFYRCNESAEWETEWYNPNVNK